MVNLMNVVTLTGSEGALGKRVVELLKNEPEISRIVALDRVRLAKGTDPRVQSHRVDLLNGEIVPLLVGADTLIHLASVISPEKPGRGGESAEFQLAERALGAAIEAGVNHVVVISSAAVYGAYPTNPVPLTEDAPLKPNPGFAFAEVKAEIEVLVVELRAKHPEITISVLRPTVTVADDGASWLGQTLANVPAVAAGDIDPPEQFLHFDDLAQAVVLAARKRLNGAFNVAPHGWISPDAMGAFRTIPKPRVPVWAANSLAWARARVTASAPPPAALPLTIYPWVVANDRLREAGWEPAFTNEEAYIASTEPGPFDSISPKRRQELALGVAGGAIVATGVGVAALVRRQLGRRK